MTTTDEPSRLLVDSMDEITEMLDDKITAELSRRMTTRLLFARAMHPLGVHYMVPLRRYDKASGRFVTVGSTCWLC